MSNTSIKNTEITFTLHELTAKLGEAYASWYWARRNTFRHNTKAERVEKILAYRAVRAAIANGDYRPEINERGNTIWRDEEADRRATGRALHTRSRYDYDFVTFTSWTQFDTKQDASYFGIWVDPVGLRTFSYIEGDKTLVECPSPAHFDAELAAMAEFYGSPPPAFVTIDHNGALTHYYAERPTRAAPESKHGRS